MSTEGDARKSWKPSRLVPSLPSLEGPKKLSQKAQDIASSIAAPQLPTLSTVKDDVKSSIASSISDKAQAGSSLISSISTKYQRTADTISQSAIATEENVSPSVILESVSPGVPETVEGASKPVDSPQARLPLPRNVAAAISSHVVDKVTSLSNVAGSIASELSNASTPISSISNSVQNAAQSGLAAVQNIRPSVIAGTVSAGIPAIIEGASKPIDSLPKIPSPQNVAATISSHVVDKVTSLPNVASSIASEVSNASTPISSISTNIQTAAQSGLAAVQNIRPSVIAGTVSAGIPAIIEGASKPIDSLPKIPSPQNVAATISSHVVDKVTSLPNVASSIASEVSNASTPISSISTNIQTAAQSGLAAVQNIRPSVIAGTVSAGIPAIIEGASKPLDSLPKIPSPQNVAATIKDKVSSLPNVAGSISAIASSSSLLPSIPGAGLLSEVTPLLGSAKKIQIPWFQVSILLFLQTVKPLISRALSPFTPELIRKAIDPNMIPDEQLASVAGFLRSMFYVMEAATVLYWSKTSDKVGRKPIILIGTLGCCLSMIIFGISQSLWASLASRSIMSGLDGNAGVIKGMMAEMVDLEDLPQIYSFTPLAHALGASVGPLINKYLSSPSDTPNNLAETLMGVLNTLLYIFTSSVPAALALASFALAFIFLKETVKAPAPISSLLFNVQNVPDPDPEHEGGVPRRIVSALGQIKPRVQDGLALGETVATNVAKKLPFKTGSLMLSMRALFANWAVIIALVNFGFLSLIDITFRTVLPLFLANPMPLGGLGLPQEQIDKVLAGYNILNGILQLIFFTSIHNRLGSRKTFMYGVASAVPLFVMFPITGYLANHFGHGTLLWTALSIQFILSIRFNLAFGTPKWIKKLSFRSDIASPQVPYSCV
ncbi:hypothetical protein H0H93_009919 [Arthromyces matolae]|nr:hypothetical protein H0H93_009919 [Arthromyces matolae]